LVQEDLERMRLPNLYWEVSGDGVSLVKGKVEVLGFVDKICDVVGKGYGLLLWGTNGVGKTACAALVAKEACRFGWTVLFIRVADLLAWETKKELFSVNDAETVWNRARRVDLLVLDDLGKETLDAAGKTLKELEEFIRERISMKRSTVFTTNLDVRDEMPKIYMESMMSVMKESILAVHCKGPDHRKQKAENVKQFLTGVDTGRVA
jgi:DNA replication protein DnaC